MTRLDQVPPALRKLELRLASATAQLIEDFKAETGIAPDSISINLREVSTLGGRDYHVLVNVDATCYLKSDSHVGTGGES